jgi:alkaline phosphatase D
MSRRRFVGAGGAGAAGLILGGGPFTSKSLAAPAFGSYPYTLGVASGDPVPRGVVLWTRLAPDPLDGGGLPPKAIPVRWEVANDERFKKVVASGTEQARPELAHSVHAEVAGLRPGREYFYRFKAGREISPVGRTKTAPPARSAASELRFAFVSCQQYEHGYYTAYRRLAEEDLDVVFHLGDYIYEYGANEYVAKGGNVRTHSSPEIMDLQAYRNRHAQYRSDGDLQAAHEAFPWVVTWDDHEVENNYADETSEDGVDPALFLQRRAAAYQAYYEHMPLRRSSVPRGPDMRLYRRIDFGDLVSFNVLDTRQYRDDQAAGDGTKPPNPEQADPARTLTGAAQERWLFNNFRTTNARWNVLAQQVFFAQQDRTEGPDQSFSMDAWDGYLGSRERVQAAFQRFGVSNPIVLTGDVHANWANELLADYDDPDSEVIGTEFVGTSITSGGNGADQRADTPRLLAENPHIKFFNDLRGYVRCRVTESEWRADYRVLPFVSRKGAAISTRASFAVQDGTPGLEQIGARAVAGARKRSGVTEGDRVRRQELAR